MGFIATLLRVPCQSGEGPCTTCTDCSDLDLPNGDACTATTDATCGMNDRTQISGTSGPPGISALVCATALLAATVAVRERR